MNGQLRPEPRCINCSYIRARLSNYSLCIFWRQLFKGKRKLDKSSDHNEEKNDDRKNHYSSYESWAKLIDGVQLTEEKCRNKLLKNSPKLNQKVYKNRMELVDRMQSTVEENAFEALKDSTRFKSDQKIYMSLKHWKKLIRGTYVTTKKNRDEERKKPDPTDYLSYKRWRKLSKGTQLTAIEHNDEEMKRSNQTALKSSNQTVHLSKKHWRKLINGTQLKAEGQENETVKNSAKVTCDTNDEKSSSLNFCKKIDIVPDLNENQAPPDILNKVFKKDNGTFSNNGLTPAEPKTEVQKRWDAVKTSLGFPERKVFLKERQPMPIELSNILTNETCDENSLNKINETHAQKLFGKTRNEELEKNYETFSKNLEGCKDLHNCKPPRPPLPILKKTRHIHNKKAEVKPPRPSYRPILKIDQS